MGIVSSTFASLAIQLAWNCQRLLDPQYRCVEGKRNSNDKLLSSLNLTDKRCVNDKYLCTDNSHILTNCSTSTDGSGDIVLNYDRGLKNENNDKMIVRQNSFGIENKTNVKDMRGRISTARKRYVKKRTASFDTALIINRSSDNYHHSNQYVNCIVTSTPSPNPSPLGRPRPQFWDVTSSSGCSSDSGSNLDSESEIEDRLNQAFIKKTEDGVDEDSNQITMSADEEAAFRMTVGRGHFSRSKKDRFLNHLRLEKRLNGLNNSTFYGTAYNIGHGRRNFSRRYSGELYRVKY